MDINYTHHDSELCLYCVFVNNTNSRGCLVLLLNTNTFEKKTVNISRMRTNSAQQCITLIDSGNYMMTVYDWEQDGSVGSRPAITRDVGWLDIPIRFGKCD